MQINQLQNGDEQSFNAFFAIYESSLVQREQKTKREIKEMCYYSEYTILLASENGVVIGFSIIFMAQDNSFCLLEYIAIAQTHRSSGKGGELFIKSYDHISSKKNNIPMLIEVDSNREISPDQIIREKRQQFYKRLGCKYIKNLDYIFPLPGSGQAPQMDLLLYQSNSLDILKKSELTHWLKVIYQQVYHCQADDIRINQMLKNIPDLILLA